MNDFNRYNRTRTDDCHHTFAPLGMERISMDEQKVEVIAVIFCPNCGMFRTKILYFDRQKSYKS